MTDPNLPGVTASDTKTPPLNSFTASSGPAAPAPSTDKVTLRIVHPASIDNFVCTVNDEDYTVTNGAGSAFDPSVTEGIIDAALRAGIQVEEVDQDAPREGAPVVFDASKITSSKEV